MSAFQYFREIQLGRRPKGDNLDDSLPYSNEEEEEELEEDEEDVDEEVDFDTPSFGRGGGIWNDYAEDLDYDQ